MGNSIQRQLLITIFIFSLEYLFNVASIHFGMLSCQGLLIEPHNMARKVRTLSTVRHPELIALYASAPNQVLGQ